MASCRWFPQNVTGQEAQQLLMTKGRDGSFLCRPSQNKKDYTLSVRRGGSVTHIKIQNKGNQFDLYDGDSFESLSELIDCYMKKGIPEKNGGVIHLVYHLNCQEPTPERWFHGHLSSADASQLIKEKGKSGSFLVRESSTTPGNYVVTVRSDEIIQHVVIRNIDGKYDCGGGAKFDTISELVDYYRTNPMVEKGGTVVHMKQPLNSTKFTASLIKDRVTELKKENDTGKDGFCEEFEQVQQQEQQHESRKVGLSSENKNKNRFKMIVPYDLTRVVLKDGVDDDYINASYITGEHAHEYIATQGCLPDTTVDFWRMVWLENSRVILLANREVEKGKSRCEKYWPDVDQSMDFGRFTVICNKETENQEFIRREFELKNNVEIFAPVGALVKPEKETRIIYHYQFVGWPEHGIPENIGTVPGILHEISLKQKGSENSNYFGPVIFQCSNGVGRTGTFIVVDILLKVLQRKGFDCELDVQKVVQQVRGERRGMVQQQAQYKFIYLALAHFIEMEHLSSQQQQQQQRQLFPRATPTLPYPSRHTGPMPTPPSISVNGETPPPTPPPRDPGHAPPNILLGMNIANEQPESPAPGTPPARPPPRAKKPT